MDNLVETNGLCKRYNDALRVRQLNLAVPEGAIYGFLGPNGAGKSTTLKMLLGLVKPTAGDIYLFGQKLTKQNRLPILAHIGSLIESPSYYGHLTGAENLRIVQTLRKAPSKNIDTVLEIVRLDGQRDKKVAHYSLGMKQRLGLAMALLAEPRLLILDEPTNGLDPAGIQEMRELICQLPQKFGMTVIVSSHLLSEIDQMATHVGIIAKGALVYQNTMAQLHAQSSHHLALRTDNNALANAVLAPLGITCQYQDGWLLLPTLSDEAAADCSKALARNGVGILRLEDRAKSLEDIFLHLTEGAESL